MSARSQRIDEKRNRFVEGRRCERSEILGIIYKFFSGLQYGFDVYPFKLISIMNN